MKAALALLALSLAGLLFWSLNSERPGSAAGPDFGPPRSERWTGAGALELESAPGARAASVDSTAAPEGGSAHGAAPSTAAALAEAPAPRETFEMVVRRAADRQPVAGARVEWLLAGRSEEARRGVRTRGLQACFTELEGERGAALSDAGGGIRVPVAPGLLLVRASTTELRGGAPVELRGSLELEGQHLRQPAGVDPSSVSILIDVSGRVDIAAVTREGAPVSGVDVGVFAEVDRVGNGFAMLSNVGETDAHGRALLDVAISAQLWGREGPKAFVARVQGGAPAGARHPVEAGDPRMQTVRLELDSAGDVELVVLDAGGAPVRAPLWLAVVPPGTRSVPLGLTLLGEPELRVETGRARFVELEPGASMEARVVDGSGFVELAAQPFVVGASPTVEVRLGALPPVLSARLLAPDGAPVANERLAVHVRTRRPGGPSGSAPGVEPSGQKDPPDELRFSVETDGAGGCGLELWHLLPRVEGRIDVTFHRTFDARGQLVALVEGVEFGPGARLKLGDLTFDERPPNLSGRLIDERGGPFVGRLKVELDPAATLLSPFRQSFSGSATSDADGRFAFPGSPGFRGGRLRLDHPTHVLAGDTWTEFPNRELELVAVPGGRVEVRHPSLSSRLLQTVRVRFRPLDPSVGPSVWELEPGGVTSIGPLEPRAYRVELGAAGHLRAFAPASASPVPFEVAEVGLGELELPAEAWGQWTLGFDNSGGAGRVGVELIDAEGEVRFGSSFDSNSSPNAVVELFGGAADRVRLDWTDGAGVRHAPVLELEPGEHRIDLASL